ncbi:glycoside hydrolase family 76 protein [Cercophora newfieldiana]|uniref:Mannan endo-1,6-alpha-mannosidase n=1 Tax=Cercophora newfieldiana TaxID=92897 RepID=A0AA39YA83_9PEZI|nr:glycoside hydrolase family 76 protein [Cercophora newfieldiana]
MGGLIAFAATTLLLLFAACGVGAQSTLQVELTSPSSIRSASKVVARSLLSHYNGDEPGQTIGILPGPPPKGPYYWWQAGAMFGTLIDYWFYTGDDEYNKVTTQALLFQAAPPLNSYMPANWTASLGNDDQGFWGMAAMLAAETNFPNPPKDEPQWLALAQAVFNTQAARWETTDCNGGLRWQIPPSNGGYNYKNTIANSVFFNLASRLARYTENTTYADWADKSWDWMVGVGYIDGEYNVYDGGHVEVNCTNINKVQFSANAAMLIHGSAIMYNITNGNEKWRGRVDGLISKTLEHFFPDGIMVERACELEDKVQCNVDQHSFKGYMHRALATAAMVAPFTRQSVMTVLRSSTAGCVKACLSDGTCGFRWTTSYDGDVANGPAGQEMSALAALSTLLVEQKNQGPFTNKTGGTSIGDPNAGGNPFVLQPPPPVTTGWRAGAGILTAVVLATMVGGLAWISGPWGENS